MSDSRDRIVRQIDPIEGNPMTSHHARADHRADISAAQSEMAGVKAYGTQLDTARAILAHPAQKVATSSIVAVSRQPDNPIFSAALDAERTRVVELSAEMRDLKAQNTRLQQIILNSANQNSKLALENANLIQALSKLLSESQASEKSSDHASGSLHNMEVEMLKARAEIESVIERLDRTQGELDTIRRSTSWRISRPLRAVARRMPPSMRRFGRRVVLTLWYTATFQLGARLHEHRLLMQAKAGQGK